jgi:hypothetical protein
MIYGFASPGIEEDFAVTDWAMTLKNLLLTTE